MRITKRGVSLALALVVLVALLGVAGCSSAKQKSSQVTIKVVDKNSSTTTTKRKKRTTTRTTYKIIARVVGGRQETFGVNSSLYYRFTVGNKYRVTVSNTAGTRTITGIVNE